VDPTLSQYSNRTAVRPPERPGESVYPATPARAEPLGCGGGLEHGSGWAGRLPHGMPLMKGARLLNEAGSARGKCLVVIANFLVPGRPAEVIDWYWPRVTGSGFSGTQLARGGDQALFGRQERSSYVLIASARGEASEVGLVFRTAE
jgi:hypothetical protein